MRPAEDDAPLRNESVLDKARILVDLLAEHRALTLAGLTRHTGWPKSTVHRLIVQLCDWGIVTRDHDTFILGQRLVELAASIEPPAARISAELLVRVGRPYIVELYSAFHMTFGLHVLEGPTTVRCVDRVRGPGRDPSIIDIGARGPVHCTAAGKAIAAFSRSGVIRTVVSDSLRPRTPLSITSREAMGDELHRVRARGYAWTDGEYDLNWSAVAVPVLSPDGSVHGSITCGGSGLKGAWATAPIDTLVGAMQHQARRVGREMLDAQRRERTALSGARGDS